MAGVVVMSINIPGENQTPWLGVPLSVASAFSAAVYKVSLIKRGEKKESFR